MLIFFFRVGAHALFTILNVHETFLFLILYLIRYFDFLCWFVFLYYFSYFSYLFIYLFFVCVSLGSGLSPVRCFVGWLVASSLLDDGSGFRPG